MKCANYLKWSSLFVLLFFWSGCKKEIPYSMKSGYYAAVDIRMYTNGSIDTFYYTLTGPYIVSNSLFRFQGKKQEGYIEQIVSKTSDYYTTEIRRDGGFNNTWIFKTIDLEITETSLYCYREFAYDSATPGVFNNYITLTYIE